MRLLPALACCLLASAALAGCNDAKATVAPQPFTCPDGTVIDLAQPAPTPASGHHGHGAASADPLSRCPKPPSVDLSAPATAVAHTATPIAWAVGLGDLPKAHSMLTSIRASPTPADADALAGPDSFGTELARREHNDLPFAFNVSHTFSAPGVVYLRAYAVIEGKDYWSGETAVEVVLAPPTGEVLTLTKAAGLAAGAFGPDDAELRLGDAVQVTNQDVVQHTFTWGEAGASLQALAVPAGATSDPVVLVVPGLYTLTTDDPVQPKRVSFTVRA
ncbi:MAG TPA: hypothetical protein VFH47_06605 [Candidatus Thermoplasmatota archaeon]|nr:hypothetical protein [Candidatus Thermoplasmatota archaeon]